MRLLPQSPPTGRLSKPVHWSRALLAVCASTLFAAGTALAAPSLTVVISQVYGGGGNSGSTYKSDFIELHNNAAAPVSLDGWSVQYNSATGTNANQVTALSGTIPAGGYYLVKQANGTGGTLDLPTPDTTGTIAMGAGGFKVLLVNTTTALLGNSASNAAGIIDYVGCGNATIFETAVAPTPSAVNSVSRKNFGTTDTDNNSLDFTAGAAAPRNSATTPFIPTATGAPLASILTPANGATGIAANTTLSLVFNKPIDKGTGNITVNLSGGSNVYSIDVTTSAVVVSGYAATITLPGSLTPGTSYYVNMPSGTFQDQEAIPLAFAGIAGPTTWAFTTFIPDTTAPTIVSRVPVNTATGVNPVEPLVITFSEPIKVPISTGPVINIKDAGNNIVATLDPSTFADPVVVTVSGSVATLVIPASTPLKYGEPYYIEIEEGAFLDLSENPLAAEVGDTFWAYTTVDVPQLAGVPYIQTFGTYISAATLPLGWSATGPSGYLSGYVGDWASVSVGGFRGNASVYGYHHTSQTLTNADPMVQVLTLRNSTGSIITDLTVKYKGRSALPENTRLPAYSVSVAGTASSALSYSTSDGDNAQRQTSVDGLSIPVGETFQIKWSSTYPAGAGSARQIGISDVEVTSGSALFAPTVAGTNVPVAGIGGTVSNVEANVFSDGGQALTARGFVYSVTSVNPSPEIGGSGVLSTLDAATTTGALNTTLTGLAVQTAYSVRGYATNATGTSYSPAVTFTTLSLPPTLLSSYSQPFQDFNSAAFPAGWIALSSASPPVQSYAGNWGTTSSSGGFTSGGVSSPYGVLGYRHTGSTGVLTVTLRLVNGTGSELNSLYVSYLGRAFVSATTPEGRSPIWTVSVNGTPVNGTILGQDLTYSTEAGLDTRVSATVTGLSIQAGAEFSITWVSDRGLASGSSKQIGIADVLVATSTPAGYEAWKIANAGSQTPSEDFDLDGIPNGVEFFMGTSANSFTASPGIVSGAVSWPRDLTTTSNSFKVETSTDLASWTNATISYPSNLKISGSDVVFTMPTSPAKVFVRLNVNP